MDDKEIYELMLTFTNPLWAGSFKEHTPWLEDCIRRYNERESTVNKKEIELIDVDDREFRIKLHSEVPLGAPGRALTMFSRMLIQEDQEAGTEYDPFFADNLFHRKLFTTSLVDKDAAGEAALEDADVVKALVEYIAAPKSSIPEGRRRAFEEIRRIVQESGMAEKSGREH